MNRHHRAAVGGQVPGCPFGHRRDAGDGRVGAQPDNPVDEGNVGDGTREGNAGPASGTAAKNPAAPEVDHT